MPKTVRPWTAVTAAGLSLAALVACSAPEPPRRLPEPGTLVARVTDVAGLPLGGALFDGVGAFTDADGLATGTLTPGPGGFTHLTAPGFVPLWVKPLPVPVLEKSILTARLTPVDTVVEVTPGQAASVHVGPRDAPHLVVDVPARAFPLPAVLSLATLRPQDLGALAFAPRDAALPRHLESALWLGGSMHGVASGAFAPLAVSLPWPSARATPVPARFAPELGAWVAEPDACARPAGDALRCTSTRGGLLGLFGDTPAAATGDAWADAEYALHREAFDADADDALACLSVDALAASARARAAAHPDLDGVLALLSASSAARHAGQRALADALADDVTPLVTALVDATEGGGCDGLLTWSHLLELAKVYRVDSGPRRALDERLDLALWECDVWLGVVDYAFPLAPGLAEDGGARFHEGARSWSERHALRLAVDAFSQVTGTSVALVSLPAATYLDDEDGPSSCGDDFVRRTVRGQPPTARVGVALTGEVHAEVWAFHAADVATPLTVVEDVRAQRWHQGADACLLVEDTWRTDTRVADYRTQLASGFHAPLTPALAALLTDSARVANPVLDGHEGLEGVAHLEVPRAPGGAAWPVAKAQVTWRFFPVTAPR